LEKLVPAFVKFRSSHQRFA